MSVTSELVHEPPALAARRDERRAAGVACSAHALHDGYTGLIYVMLPIWQKRVGIGPRHRTLSLTHLLTALGSRSR